MTSRSWSIIECFSEGCNKGPAMFFITCGPKKDHKPWHYPIKLLILRIKVCVLRGLLLKSNSSWPLHFFCNKHQKSYKVFRKIVEPQQKFWQKIGDLSRALNEKWELLDENKKDTRGKENIDQEFPGGPEVRTWCFHCWARVWALGRELRPCKPCGRAKKKKKKESEAFKHGPSHKGETDLLIFD